jgi:hypothetical protein
MKFRRIALKILMAIGACLLLFYFCITWGLYKGYLTDLIVSVALIAGSFYLFMGWIMPLEGRLSQRLIKWPWLVYREMQQARRKGV